MLMRYFFWFVHHEMVLHDAKSRRECQIMQKKKKLTTMWCRVFGSFYLIVPIVFPVVLKDCSTFISWNVPPYNSFWRLSLINKPTVLQEFLWIGKKCWIVGIKKKLHLVLYVSPIHFRSLLTPLQIFKSWHQVWSCLHVCTERSVRKESGVFP